MNRSALALLIGMSLLVAGCGRHTPDAEQASEPEPGTVLLDQAAQQRSGIQTEALPAQTHAEERRIRGMVLPETGRPGLVIQLMVPADLSLPSPLPAVSVQWPADARFSIECLGVDPTATLRRFRCPVPEESAAGLAPGMAVTAWIPIAAPVTGIIVPEASVVWWQGASWVYIKEPAEADDRPDRFRRLQISLDAPVAGGWFSADPQFAQAELITMGAQILLSEELKSEIPEE